MIELDMSLALNFHFLCHDWTGCVHSAHLPLPFLMSWLNWMCPLAFTSISYVMTELGMSLAFISISYVMTELGVSLAFTSISYVMIELGVSLAFTIHFRFLCHDWTGCVPYSSLLPLFVMSWLKWVSASLALTCNFHFLRHDWTGCVPSVRDKNACQPFIIHIQIKNKTKIITANKRTIKHPTSSSSAFDD